MLVRLIARHVRPYSGLLVLVVLAQAIASISSLYLPNINGRIIDRGVVAGNTHYIWVHGGWMLGFALIQAIAQVAAAYLGGRISMSMGRDLRQELFNHVLSFSSREVNQFGAPSLITRNSNDVQQVQSLVQMSLVMMLGAPITAIGGVWMALREDIGMSWLIVVAVLLMGAGIGFLVTRLHPRFRQQQTRIDTINRVLREQITGIRVVRAFVREPHESRRFADANQGLADVATSVGRWMSVMFPMVMFLMNLSSVGVLWFGSHRVDQGHIEIGQLTAYLTYIMQILTSVMMATMMLVMWPRASVCAERITEVLDTRTSVEPPTDPVREVAVGGEVAMDAVSFTYPGAEQPVIDQISFSLRPGHTTAVIGASGSGKSTLVNLIPRLYDATSGSVLVDGVDVRRLEPDLLWSRVGLVPQKPYLFSGTVASNLRYGNPDATDEQLWQALRVAQADDFVREMDGQLEASISQGGTNVSGGQRQRLSIARALVKHADVYVFDDSFSALDVATDARLRAALAQYTHDAAVLIVAQRVSTIRTADEILVLDNGRIVARGTHDELLGSSDTYREIVDSQLSAEEAAA